MDEDDRPPGRSWWIDALDPVENLRALSDARAFGRRAAEQLADRMAGDGAGAGGNGDGGEQGGPELDALLRRLRADSLRAADLWADLVDGAAAMIGAVASRVPGLGDGAAGRDDDVVLGPVAPGGVARRVFWIDNPAAAPIDDVRPHCGPLRCSDGAELPGAVTFDPMALAPLPARSRCGVEVVVAIPADAAPGRYVTMVLVTNLPAVALPLCVAVAVDEGTG
jgi:hypothetical protein